MRVTRSDYKRFFFGEAKFSKFTKSVAINEESSIDCRPAIYEQSQLSIVRSCGFKSTIENEIAKLNATSFTESAALLFKLNNALVLGGEIFSESSRHYISRSNPYRRIFSRIESFSTVAVSNSTQGLKYFGHWLRDDCATYELARDFGKVISLSRPHWPDCDGYQTAFDQRWEEKKSFFAKELTIFQDIGFSRSKKKRLTDLRARIRHGSNNSSRYDIVYIKRGKSGSRRLIINEDYLVEALEHHGIRIVEPETGFEGLASNCLDSSMMITLEGSQAAHGVYMLANGGSLLVIQPPERFYNPHLEWTRLLGMNYGIVVGEAVGDDIFVDPDEVLRMVARLSACPTLHF